jgi:ABC-2 type transport system permease protein
MTATSPALATAPVRRGTAAAYVRYEMLRTFRNVRFFAFSLVFPLVLFFLVAGTNRHEHVADIPFPLYYMTSMAAWGAMSAVIAGGARIAAERAIGWNRQLRVTPLSVRAYLGSKVLTGYAMALISIALLYGAGLSLGVHLPIDRWIVMTLLLLVGLVPFAVMGVLIGHVVSTDSMGPAMGGTTAIFALLGGVWGPIAEHGFVHSLSELIPSHWLVEASHVALGGGVWPARGFVVIGVWTLVLARLAARAWARDTQRA